MFCAKNVACCNRSYIFLKVHAFMNSRSSDICQWCVTACVIKNLQKLKKLTINPDYLGGLFISPIPCQTFDAVSEKISRNFLILAMVVFITNPSTLDCSDTNMVYDVSFMACKCEFYYLANEMNIATRVSL